jgi:hypothetical protein
LSEERVKCAVDTSIDWILQLTSAQVALNRVRE